MKGVVSTTIETFISGHMLKEEVVNFTLHFAGEKIVYKNLILTIDHIDLVTTHPQKCL